MALTADQLKVKISNTENKKPYERPKENKKNLFKKYEEVYDDSDSEEDMKAYIRWKKRKEQRRKQYDNDDDESDDSDFEKKKVHKTKTYNSEEDEPNDNNKDPKHKKPGIFHTRNFVYKIFIFKKY